MEFLKDTTRGVKFLDKACNGGRATICTLLASLYSNGEVVRRDKTKAGEYSKKGCDAGDWMACGGYGLYLDAFKSGAKSVQYYQKACEIGSAANVTKPDQKECLKNFAINTKLARNAKL